MRVLNASFVPRAGACTALRTSPLGPTRTYCLPSLVILGAMRAGTSALCDLLSKQPRYARNADGREVHYFSDPFASPRKLAKGWPAYAARFPRRRRDELVFEKTAQYLTSPGGLAAMFAVLGPALRVVAVLREPGARLYSEFQHHCAAGRVAAAPRGARRSTGPTNGTALPRGAVVRGDVLPDGTLVAAAVCYAARGLKDKLSVLHASRRRRNANPGWLVPRGARTPLGAPWCAPADFARFLDAAPPGGGEWGEVAAGDYAVHVRAVLARWPAAAVVDAGSLRRDPAAVLAAVVGAGAAPPGAPFRPSRATRAAPMLAATRRKLDERYAAPTAALAALLGPARRGWWSGD